MRIDTVDAFLSSPLRVPRYVVGIIYPVNSPHFTSAAGMTNVPGVNVLGVIKGISGSSTRIYPSQGRSTIGGITVELLDVGSAVTDEIRSQLDSGEGIQGRTVKVYTGDSSDFNDLVQVETFIVDDVTLQDGVYRIRCVDRKRELRKDIFEPKRTRLTTTLTDSATTVAVVATADFATIVHTAAFSDAPSSTVGYIRIRKTGEIIRYTGKTAVTFTGCTREVLQTTAQAVTIDGGTATEKLPEVEEVIYLEMPVVQMLHSVMTGTIFGTANPLPAHWNLGIATADVRDADYNNIGLDLFDSTDMAAGAIARFVGLTKTDGKRWIEKELLLMIGCFMPVGADGLLGLKRLPRILEDAPFARILDSSNIVSHSALRHNLKSMANQVRIDWNWDGKKYTRTTLVLDGVSITTHGKRPSKTFRFKGLVGLRSTDQTIQIIASTFLDRAAEPPEEITLTCLPSMNDLEVGDVVRVVLPDVRDFAGTGTLSRSFLIEGRSVDWVTGKISFKCFGSSREAEVVAPEVGVPVPDGMYDDEGVALSTVLTIVADAVTVSGTLTGDADMNATGAIFYHLGNLTINAGVTVTGIDNVQLRIRGFLTINGKLDLKGKGLAGVADTNVVPVVLGPRGLAGFIGYTHGSFGIRIVAGGLHNFHVGSSGPQFGLHSAFPLLALSLVDTATTPKLNGIPTDFRGTSGGPGGAISTTPSTVNENGATGGNSGGGLYILCRGLGFGASGIIDTSGDDGVTPPSFAPYLGVDLFEGAGGGGAPGGLLILLDGDTVSLPTLAGKFVGNLGDTPMQGTPGTRGDFGNIIFPTEPGTGGPGVGPADLSASVSRIQYVPTDQEVGDSEDEVIPPPTTLAAAAGGAGVVLSWVNPPAERFNYIEVFESLTNNRASAVLIGRVNTEEAVRLSDAVITRFYWIRARHELLGVSDFEPLSATAGVQVTFGGLPAGSLVGTVNLDTQVSGTLATVNAETGLINTSITINATGTLGGAGGGQASMDSLPGTVSVGSAEAGLINVNITINAVGTLGGAGGGQANLANLPGLVGTGSAVAGLVNVNITINASGTLGGAGGGQASMDSLPGTVSVASAETGLINTSITINANATLSGAGGGTPSLASITGSITLTTQVTGLLPTGNAATGLRNTSVTINASGTLGGAGGGQASMDSLPGTVSVASAETGLINTSITINAVGTLGGAGGGQASMSSLPGTVQVGSAATGLINTSITINATGSLSGAGGGQANLASLPGLVGTGSAVGGLVNVNITINNDGSLSGAGGGQASLALLKTKTADEIVNNSNVLQDDNHLTGFNLQANTWYSIEIYLQFFSATGTIPSLKWDLVFSQTPQVTGHGLAMESGTLTNQIRHKAFSAAGKVFVADINVEAAAFLTGTFRTHATTGGTLKLQWAQNIARVADLILRQSSHIRLTPLT